MSEVTEKTWKVVKIISDYEIVINGGKKDLLSRGNKLEIFVPGERLEDPETGEFLGVIDRIKAYIKVEDVFENMSVCKNAENKVTNVLSAWYMQTGESNRLNVDPNQISGPIAEYDKTIRIGDLVRKSR